MDATYFPSRELCKALFTNKIRVSQNKIRSVQPVFSMPVIYYTKSSSPVKEAALQANQDAFVIVLHCGCDKICCDLEA